MEAGRVVQGMKEDGEGRFRCDPSVRPGDKDADGRVHVWEAGRSC